MPLPLQWVQHLQDPKERKDFEDLIRSSTRVLGRLSQIADDRASALDRAEMTQTDFDEPNWAYRQAFRNGQRSSLKFIKDLLNLDPISIRPE